MKDTQLKVSEEYVTKFIMAIRAVSKKTASLVESSLQNFFQAIPRRDTFRAEHGFIPYNLAISPTYKCNLNCVDCYSQSSRDQSTVLDPHTIDMAIQEATEKWVLPFFSISGGEPLYHALEISRKHPTKIFQLYTNGTLITEQIAEELAEKGNLVPLISIQGFKEETDRIRGKRIYDKTMNVIDILKRKGVVWGISFTLTSNNADVYDNNFLEFFIAKGALLGRFIPYMPVGRGADTQKVPSAEQRKKQGDALRRIEEAGVPFYSMDYINNPRVIEGCAAGGLRYVHIDPSGDVYPCVFIPVHAKFNLNDVYDGKHAKEGVTCLEDILVKDELMKKIRQAASKTNSLSCCLVIDNKEELDKVILGCK